MYREQTIIVDGIPVCYRVNTQGGPKEFVLLLHGWGSNKESFSLIQSKIHNAISVDLPGFGKTPLGKGDWDVSRYARFISQWCSKIGIENNITDIVGHSFGGRIAVELTSKKLLETESITLVGTPIYRMDVDVDTVVVRLGRLIKRIPGGAHLRNWYYRRRLGVDDYLDAEGTELEQVFQNIITYQVADHLDQVGVPVRLLWGQNDQTIELEQATQSAKQYGYLVTTVSDAGHFPFLDQPDRFVDKYYSLGK